MAKSAAVSHWRENPAGRPVLPAQTWMLIDAWVEPAQVMTGVEILGLPAAVVIRDGVGRLGGFGVEDPPPVAAWAAIGRPAAAAAAAAMAAIFRKWRRWICFSPEPFSSGGRFDDGSCVMLTPER